MQILQRRNHFESNRIKNLQQSNQSKVKIDFHSDLTAKFQVVASSAVHCDLPGVCDNYASPDQIQAVDGTYR